MLGSGATTTTEQSFVQQATAAATTFGISVREVLPGAAKAEDSNGACFSELSYETRLHGFTICFVSGFVISFVSVLMLTIGNVAGFAIIYSLGNILAMLATGFLVGPKKQCKNMFDRTRVVATTIFFLTLIATLIVAFKANALLVIPLIIVQWLAGLWYVASYIPFARDAICNCCKTSVAV